MPMPSSSWLCRPRTELEPSAQMAEQLDVQREQLPIDWLDQIIVRPGLEPGNLVGDHATRGDDHQHYVARERLVVESGQQVQPTHVAQIELGHHQPWLRHTKRHLRFLRACHDLVRPARAERTGQTLRARHVGIDKKGNRFGSHIWGPMHLSCLYTSAQTRSHHANSWIITCERL